MEHLQGQLPLLIGGQRRTLYFDYTFVSTLYNIIPAKEFEQATPFRQIPAIVYAALLSAPKGENNLPDDFSERMAEGWLMGTEPGSFELIYNAYKHAMGFIGGSLSVLIQAVAPPAKPAKSIPKATQ